MEARSFSGGTEAHANPRSSLVAAPTEPEPLRSASIPVSSLLGALRLLRWPPLSWRCLPAGNTRRRSPALPCLASVRAAPNTPAGRPGASVLSPGHRWSSPFSGRLDPRITLRGLLRLPSRCGPYLADLPLQVEPCPWSFDPVVTRLRLPVIYPGIPTIPGVGTSPTVTQYLSAAHLIMLMYVKVSL